MLNYATEKIGFIPALFNNLFMQLVTEKSKPYDRLPKYPRQTKAFRSI